MGDWSDFEERCADWQNFYGDPPDDTREGGLMLAERATHQDYKPEDLLHVELCQGPRRYEATMSDGEVLILPSVTTILGGGSGEAFSGNEATRIGTTVHDYAARCERFLAQLAADLSQEDPRAQNAFGLYSCWRGLVPALAAHLPALVEVPVCSIVYGYAGTLDLLLINGFGAILHDHTSQEIREEALAQVVAYARALDEMLEAGTAPAGTVPYGPPAAVQVGRFGKACQAHELRRVERASWGPHWRRFLAKLESR